MCFCEQRYRWQGIAGRLHAFSNVAYPGKLFPGDEIHTLCDEHLTVTREDTRRHAMGDSLPICRTCHRRWSRHLHESHTAMLTS